MSFIARLTRLHGGERLNIDPLPVALRLWEHTRAGGELASPREAIMQAHAANMPDMSAQDRKHTALRCGPRAENRRG